MKHNLFSTPVWHIKGTSQELIDELYEAAYKVKEVYKDTPKRSNEGGYQTPVIEWESFHPEGKDLVEKAIRECDKSIFPNFKIQGWWYNINGKGHWNHPHTHPNCDIAAVLYLTDSDGLLHLLSPFPQRRVDRNGDHVSVAAQKGDIILFPSDIVHYVLPNERDSDRISITMNLQLC